MAVGAIGFRAKFVARCAESGAPAQTGRATMSKAKLFALVASVAAVSLGSTASLAQQPPPQSPNMTFFITSSGPGKGADLGGLEGAGRQCPTLAQAAGGGASALRPSPRTPPNH